MATRGKRELLKVLRPHFPIIGRLGLIPSIPIEAHDMGLITGAEVAVLQRALARQTDRYARAWGYPGVGDE